MEHYTNKLIQQEIQGNSLEDFVNTLFSDWNTINIYADKWSIRFETFAERLENWSFEVPFPVKFRRWESQISADIPKIVFAGKSL
jgi:hypothetical protein